MNMSNEAWIALAGLAGIAGSNAVNFLRYLLGTRYVTHKDLATAHKDLLEKLNTTRSEVDAKLRPITDAGYLLRDSIKDAHNRIDLLQKDVAGLPDYDKHNDLKDGMSAIRVELGRLTEQLKASAATNDLLRQVLEVVREEMRIRRQA